MSNLRLKDHTWDAANVYDSSLGKTQDQINAELAGKQETLVSGVNIKTINGASILEAGNIEIQGGGGSSVVVDDTLSIPGAAADAKKTGDELSDLKSAVIDDLPLDLTDKRNAFVSSVKGAQVSFESSSASYSFNKIIYVKAFETYTIAVRNGTTVASPNIRNCIVADNNDVVRNVVSIQTTANAVNTTDITPTVDGYLVLTVDKNYLDISITVNYVKSAGNDWLRAINYFFDDTELLTPTISSKTNNAITDNGDGTFTIRATDYGDVFFDSPLYLVPGLYKLFGVPAGFSFVNTSESHDSPIVINSRVDAIDVNIETSGWYYVGYRDSARPSAAFTITPSFKRVGDIPILREQIDGNEFIGQSDVITSYISKTNNAITNNGDGTFTIGTGDFGTVIFREMLLHPGFYKLFGVSNGFSFLSTDTLYTSAFITNETAVEKPVIISEKTHCYLGYRNSKAPSSRSIITPYLIADRVASANSRIDSLEDSIQPYYSAELADTVAKVRSANNEPALVFPWVTDIHRYTASVQTFNDMIANMKAFAKQVKCDFILNTGDTIEGNASQAKSLGYAYDSIGSFKDIGEPFFYSEGNHDNNPYISSGTLVFTLKQVFGGFFAASKGMTFNVNENGTDYYVDYANLGVRFISVNSCNSTIANNYGFGNSTAAWLENALDTEHIVILATHVSPISQHVWSNNSPGNVSSIRTVIASFVNNGGKLIILTGHSHVDAEFVNPYVEITDVCQKFEKADTSDSGFTTMSGQIDGLRNPERTAGTYTADAWSICVFKPFSNELDVIRFGAGVDRYIHCEAIAPTTLTTKLTGAITWSSSDTNIATVSDGVVSVVSVGKCAVIAKDDSGNIEVWVIAVT